MKDKNRSWLSLVPAYWADVFDIVITATHQNPDYWRGNLKQANEGNPIGAYVMANHIFVFFRDLSNLANYYWVSWPFRALQVSPCVSFICINCQLLGSIDLVVSVLWLLVRDCVHPVQRYFVLHH